ncbi:DUF6230 family protein [Streptomyces sp. NBC_01445]|uniref:DUF6230 family protein n=1 Tax=Streptomyces sp. NBC_01445 TaxID=2903869 RepID=UPI002DD83B65|nr:DUF6230 family protein [Streptomyces sp. NBC_01445]WSE08485.1 DUF6230 family protein [Streptomyces sp. NBC_01445]
MSEAQRHGRTDWKMAQGALAASFAVSGSSFLVSSDNLKSLGLSSYVPTDRDVDAKGQGGRGKFGLQARGIEVAEVRSHAWSATGGNFRLRGMKVAVSTGGKKRFRGAEAGSWRGGRCPERTRTAGYPGWSRWRSRGRGVRAAVRRGAVRERSGAAGGGLGRAAAVRGVAGLVPLRSPVRWLYGLVGLPDRHWRVGPGGHESRVTSVRPA